MPEIVVTLQYKGDKLENFLWECIDSIREQLNGQTEKLTNAGDDFFCTLQVERNKSGQTQQRQRIAV